jgi:hypothetical protein
MMVVGSVEGLIEQIKIGKRKRGGREVTVTYLEGRGGPEQGNSRIDCRRRRKCPERRSGGEERAGERALLQPRRRRRPPPLGISSPAPVGTSRQPLRPLRHFS